MRKILLLLIMGIFLINLVSASRLPTINGDEDSWGSVLNDFLSRIAGDDAIELNLTMVSGKNIYPSAINTTHIFDGTINSSDLGTDSVKDDEIDYTEVTISDFTNDANYLDKDDGGVIDGSLILNGNLTLIGNYFNATVTNQYLNGSFFPDSSNIFDIGSSLSKWANLFVSNIYASKIYANDWSNVSITESQITDLQGYLTSESDPVYSAWDKDYNDLINQPTIPVLWDEDFNTTGDSRWGGGGSQMSVGGNYLYNDTTTIYFNETSLNTTIGIYNTSLYNWVVDKSYLKSSDWNATNTSYYLKSNPFNFYNSTDFDYNNYLLSGDWNATNTSYYLKSNPFGFYNATNPPAESDPHWTANQSSYSKTATILDWNYYNSTDFSISDYFTKSEIIGFSYYNSSDFDISDYYLKTDIDGFNYWNDTYAKFNKTYADTLYLTSYTESDPFWTANSTLVGYLASSNQWTANQNMTNKNITDVQCIKFQNGASWCGV